MRVNELIRFLKQFPSDAMVHAYEGEVSGVIVMSKNRGRTLGVIHNDGTLEMFHVKQR